MKYLKIQKFEKLNFCELPGHLHIIQFKLHFLYFLSRPFLMKTGEGHSELLRECAVDVLPTKCNYQNTVFL